MDRTLEDLQQKQMLPLSVKVLMTKQRIRQWVNEFGEDGVYISFSGGKDSTVLLDIAREMYPNLRAMYVDTGLEYREVRNHVKKFDNVDWIKPEMTFKQIIKEYGFPFTSKETAYSIDSLVRFIEWCKQEYGEDTTIDDVKKILVEEWGSEHLKKSPSSKVHCCKLLGIWGIDGKPHLDLKPDEKSHYNCDKWLFMVDAPFRVSDRCCLISKKNPAHDYEKQTGRLPMLGTMASESKMRTTDWLRFGCNAFDSNRKKSTPMAFWMEQDVLMYIKTHNLSIPSVYGEIVYDIDSKEESMVDGQMTLFDLSEDFGVFDNERPLLKTTGCQRTGCVYCGFGCHHRDENKFVLLRENDPQLFEYVMKPEKNGGLGFKEKFEWFEAHGVHIKY